MFHCFSGGLERHWANFPDHKTFSKIAEDVADAEKNDREENPTGMIQF